MQATDTSLAQESRFWGAVTRKLLASGALPYDMDRRRATRIEDSDLLLRLGSRRADPAIEERWRGQFVDRTLDVLKKMGARRVLELGCGAGWLALEMARRGVEVHAVDLSEERIQLAHDYYRERAAHEELAPVRHEVQNIETFSPEPLAYDAIVSFTTLHHLHDKHGLLQRCHDALPRDGKLIVFDDDHDAGVWPWRFVRGLVVLALALCLLPLPSPVPRRRRALEAVSPLARGCLPSGLRQRIRGLAAPILWPNRDDSVLAEGSPFEGVDDGHDHGHSLDDMLASVFDDVAIRRSEVFGLRQLLVLGKLPGALRPVLTALFYRLDNTFAGSAWFPGTVIYAVATKRRD